MPGFERKRKVYKVKPGPKRKPQNELRKPVVLYLTGKEIEASGGEEAFKTKAYRIVGR